MIKKKSTLMKRRKAAIIAVAIAIAVLAVALVFILDYVKTTTVTDPADGTNYYIRYKNDIYALYDTDRKTVMPTEEEYGYYETHAGTLIDVDAETGEYEIIAVVDTEGNEQVGFNQRLLMFPHIEKSNIRQLEVNNESGSFTFVRYNVETGKVDDSADFIIKGSPLTVYNQELFASLYVSAGYTLTTRKIQDPIKDENGEFSEYGLVAERRTRTVVDEDGNPIQLKDENGAFVYGESGYPLYESEEIDYVPAYYVLTDTSGNKYKVIIGDALVTGGGYYVQYVDMSGEEEVKRDAVYVLASDFGDSMLAAIEDYVTPQLTYPMAMNDYFDVEDFIIFNKNHAYVPGTSDDGEESDADNSNTENSEGEEEKEEDITTQKYLDPVVGFDYIDLTERENTIRSNEPYVFLSSFKLSGYQASNDKINACLQGLYDPAYVKVVKFDPSMEDFIKYKLAFEDGVDKDGKPEYTIYPEHIISYKFDTKDEDGNVNGTVYNFIYVSEVTEKGTRYAFTEVYDTKKDGSMGEILYDYKMIVEIEDHSLEFLNWDRYDWINSSYFNLGIAFCDKITISTPDYDAVFELDNSESDSVDSINSTLLKVIGSDSEGNEKTTFSQLKVVDESGNLWVITGTEIKCYNSEGTEYTKIKSAHYDYNVMKTQVRVFDGYIPAADGSRVYVDANQVRVVSDTETVYVRYDTNLFRKFYQTLLYASISDSYEMSAEDEAALIADESKLLLTMTVLNSEGEETVYKFYRLTSRKTYITINGNGGFYVISDRVEKIVSDCQKFFAGELIDATSKR